MARRETRNEWVRTVEYSPFPRNSAEQGLREGFTRDLSTSGLCLRGSRPEAQGALLRVVVRHVDGRPAREVIARVAWSAPAPGGGHWIGLSIVEECPTRSWKVAGPGTRLSVISVA